MINSNYLALFALVFTLAGCSSGSSTTDTAADQTTSDLETATAIGENDVTQLTEVNGEDEIASDETSQENNSEVVAEQNDPLSADSPIDSSDPSTDENGNEPATENNSFTDQETSGNSEQELNTANENDVDVESESEASSSETDSDGSATEPDPDISASDIEQDLENNGVETPSDDVETPDDTPSEDEPVETTPVGALQSTIRMLSARTLQSLNQSLAQGEFLSPQQEQCIGSYDPAIGAPLLAIDCEARLATGNIQIYANSASFIDTPACRADISDPSIEPTDVDCRVDEAVFRVNTFWTVNTSSTTPVSRPQPTPGATITLDSVEDILRIENLEDRLSGVFVCEYQLSTGNLISGNQVGSCSSEPSRINDLITLHLNNAEL